MIDQFSRPADNKEGVFPFTKPGSKITWLYNWSPIPTSGAESLEFIPMQWNAEDIDSLRAKINSAGATTVLGFNEPELPDQANMDVHFAAREWLRAVEPLRRQGVRCGSPAISNAGHAVGWLVEFIKLIRQGGSDVDFYCFHAYFAEIGPFYDYLWSAYHQMPDQSKPVWLTEYACTNENELDPLPQQHVEHFARTTFKYLDELDWIERYSWFGPMRNVGRVGKWARMLDDNGQLTSLGRIFRDE